jgi:hypothetical protein
MGVNKKEKQKKLFILFPKYNDEKHNKIKPTS